MTGGLHCPWSVATVRTSPADRTKRQTGDAVTLKGTNVVALKTGASRPEDSALTDPAKTARAGLGPDRHRASPCSARLTLAVGHSALLDGGTYDGRTTRSGCMASA